MSNNEDTSLGNFYQHESTSVVCLVISMLGLFKDNIWKLNIKINEIRKMLVSELSSPKIHFIDTSLNIVEHFEYKNKTIMHHKVNLKQYVDDKANINIGELKSLFR